MSNDKNNIILPYKLCIGFLTKNNDKWIDGVLQNVNTYISLFQDYEVFIVDGYSTDNTKIKCDEWCSLDPQKRQTVFQPSKELSRDKSLAEARNMVLNHYRPQFGAQTLFMMLDSDSPNCVPFDVEGFLKPFIAELDEQKYPEYKKKWKALFANQPTCYYDVWTLRDEECVSDWQIEWRMTGDINCHKKYQKPKPASLGLWPVKSAFGGAGLYRTEFIKDTSNYFGTQYLQLPTQVISLPVCEHVPFNFSIGEPMYVNCAWMIGDHE